MWARTLHLTTKFRMPKKQGKQVKKNAEKVEIQGPVTVNNNGDVTIKIHAKPGSKANGITAISSDSIGVQIAAPPVDGEANTELIKYISTVIGVRKSNIALDKGSKSREKILMVCNTGLTVDAILEKLNQEMTDHT